MCSRGREADREGKWWSERPWAMTAPLYQADCSAPSTLLMLNHTTGGLGQSRLMIDVHSCSAYPPIATVRTDMLVSPGPWPGTDACTAAKYVHRNKTR